MIMLPAAELVAIAKISEEEIITTVAEAGIIITVAEEEITAAAEEEIMVAEEIITTAISKKGIKKQIHEFKLITRIIKNLPGAINIRFFYLRLFQFV